MRKSANFIYLTTETQTVAKTIVSRKFSLFYFSYCKCNNISSFYAPKQCPVSFFSFQFSMHWIFIWRTLHRFFLLLSFLSSSRFAKMSVKNLYFVKIWIIIRMEYEAQICINSDVIIPTAHEILKQHNDAAAHSTWSTHNVLICYLTICKCVCSLYIMFMTRNLHANEKETWNGRLHVVRIFFLYLFLQLYFTLVAIHNRM